MLLLVPRGAAAQDVISGTVVSADDGEALPGVNVVVVGTNVGTATSTDGEYTLEGVPAEADSVQFSFVGYETQTEAIAGRSTIDVVLSPAAEELGEMVVIGYGEESEALLTESTESVSAEQISETPVSSPEQALQGRVSGVQITSAGASPDAPTAVRVRGVGTVGNTQPLFVIDGVPVGRGGNASVGGKTTNPLSTLNPENIESISVLKDASAAAVYGVRAANGVVLIETKRGQDGEPSISFDSYYGSQRPPSMWDVNSTQEWVQVTQRANRNYNQQFGYSEGNKNFRQLAPDLRGEDSSLRDIDTDWLDEALNQSGPLGGAPTQKYNLSISGGTEDLNYYVSSGYFDQEAISARWGLDRYNFRVNSDYQITDRLKFAENFSLSHRNVEHGRNSSLADGFLLANSAAAPPFFEIYDTDGSVEDNRYGYEGNRGPTGNSPRGGITMSNPVAINDLWDYDNQTTRLRGGLSGRIDFYNGGQGLAYFKSEAQIDYSLGRNRFFHPPYAAREAGLDRPSDQLSESRFDDLTQIYTNTLNYDGDLGAHSFDALAGVEYQEIRYESSGVQGGGLLSYDPSFRTTGNLSESVQPSGQANESEFFGYIGRLNYDYADKYLLTATVRRDGTSNFSSEDGRNWGTFPSVSVGWRLAEEPFMEDISALSSLKIRASWGQLGNDQTVRYPYVSGVSTVPNYGLGETTVAAATPSSFVNPNVTWETVETTDIGVESSFFNDRLSFKATYYRRITNDFLINIPISNVTGFGSAPINAGSVRNEGVELSTSYFMQVGEVNLDFSANLTTVDNEVTDLASGQEVFASGGGYRTSVGRPISYFYGYKTNGLYQSEEEAANALPNSMRASGVEAQPGDVQFVDVNDDGEITPDDRTYLGKTIPSYYYGASANASWRTFDLAVLLSGTGGVQRYNQFRRFRLAAASSGGANALNESLDSWTPENTDTEIPRLVATDPNENYRFSDKWVEDADYLRVKNLQLGYSVPPSLVDGAFRRARVYVSASNLFTFSPYEGLNPAVRTRVDSDGGAGADDQLQAGTDEGTMPAPRTYRLGLQLQF